LARYLRRFFTFFEIKIVASSMRCFLVIAFFTPEIQIGYLFP